ncbi:Tol-Pal system YbgF [Marinomonas ushuaiensis DSM 15871]|uniref:Cell division coordinator CpoB n=1 Tax=Marinomonas ushuaiensis DSM 15871 TaxID=1122207 RepID=X7E8P9_9GAMM|nr:tol-pal system protein YbgF [Marinomonas ushuaiensis]ETX11523.1 Tol-Pal system YbgF [Marinomonas ushuaiensis DSM 15871]
MIFKDVKIRSFAVVLFFTAPLASAEIQQVNGGLSSSAAADLLFQLETLQQEVQHLRGQLEEQGHALKIMKQSQRDRYIDLDKRISLLMSSSLSQQAPSVTTTPQVQQVLKPESPAVIKENSTSIELAPPLSPVILQPPSAESQQAYNNAYNLIRERKFDESEVAFTKFVQDYPDNTLTGNGYYWLGEVKLVQGKSTEAVDAFSTVIKAFPGHSKEQDALYKLGTVSDQLGDTAKAKSYLQDVIRRFPDSKASKLATGYLSKVK